MSDMIPTSSNALAAPATLSARRVAEERLLDPARRYIRARPALALVAAAAASAILTAIFWRD